MKTKHALTLARSGDWRPLKAHIATLSPQSGYNLIEAIGDACPLELSLAGLVDDDRDVLGLTVSGALLRNIGHRHRGSDMASKTSDEQFQGYYQRLVEAKDALEQALTVERRNGLAAAVYMNISVDPIEEGQKEIAEARLLDAENVPLAGYMNLLRSSLEKWGGSHEAMFRIARSRIRAEAPMQSALIAYAHSERELFYSHFDESPGAAALAETYYTGEVLEELKAASQVILSARDADPAEQNLADSWMAFVLFAADQPKRAVRHLDRQGGYQGGAWRQTRMPGLTKFLMRFQSLFPDT